MRDKLIDVLFSDRKSINLVIDGLSTCKKYISPGFWVESRDAVASKKERRDRNVRRERTVNEEIKQR